MYTCIHTYIQGTERGWQHSASTCRAEGSGQGNSIFERHHGKKTACQIRKVLTLAHVYMRVKHAPIYIRVCMCVWCVHSSKTSWKKDSLSNRKVFTHTHTYTCVCGVCIPERHHGASTCRAEGSGQGNSIFERHHGKKTACKIEKYPHTHKNVCVLCVYVFGVCIPERHHEKQTACKIEK